LTTGGNRGDGMEDRASKRYAVLLVEDDPLSSRVAEKILERLGYCVCGVFQTGEEAVEAAAAKPPDVVLMDINLAGAMDGVAAAKNIIAALGVPVIFLTAATHREVMDRVIATGAAGYIQKPVKLLDLKANLEMAINRRQHARPCPTDAAAFLYRHLLDAVVLACGRRLAVIDPTGRVIFAHPDVHQVGVLFAEAFPDEPDVPASADSPVTDALGQPLGWVRLLSTGDAGE